MKLAVKQAKTRPKTVRRVRFFRVKLHAEPESELKYYDFKSETAENLRFRQLKLF